MSEKFALELNPPISLSSIALEAALKMYEEAAGVRPVGLICSLDEAYIAHRLVWDIPSANSLRVFAIPSIPWSWWAVFGAEGIVGSRIG